VALGSIAPDRALYSPRCRFAQRVAMVKNEATINESLDPQLMIKRLKQENR
jgi:hypothetical protein